MSRRNHFVRRRDKAVMHSLRNFSRRERQ